MDRFDLDDIQADKVLDLQLYRLAKMAIEAIRELEEKLAEAERIKAILASPSCAVSAPSSSRFASSTERSGEPRSASPKRRKSSTPRPTSSSLSRPPDRHPRRMDQGQGSFTSIDKIRIREGDEIGWSPRAPRRTPSPSLPTRRGLCHAPDGCPRRPRRAHPATLRLLDGERVVGIALNDPAFSRARGGRGGRRGRRDLPPPPPYGLARPSRGGSSASPSRSTRDLQPLGAAVRPPGQGGGWVIAVGVGRRGAISWPPPTATRCASRSPR